MSGPLDPSTVLGGQTVQLLYSPDGDLPPGTASRSPWRRSSGHLPVEDSPPADAHADLADLHYQGVNA